MITLFVDVVDILHVNFADEKILLSSLPLKNSLIIFARCVGPCFPLHEDHDLNSARTKMCRMGGDAMTLYMNCVFVT